MAALIDTSAVLAAVDRADPSHGAVVRALAIERSTIVLPVVVLPEVAFLLQKRYGSARAAALVGQIVNGPWPVASLESADLQRATELMARYADARVGFVDAAIAALAERLTTVRVYTLDRRDFTILRPRHAPAFEVLPAD
jgi:predicted nucleic acid-binding protein